MVPDSCQPGGTSCQHLALRTHLSALAKSPQRPNVARLGTPGHDYPGESRNSLYKTVSEGWRTTLGVARWVCDRHGLLTGTGGNRIFRAASGVQVLRPRPLASRGDLCAVPPGRYGRRPRSAGVPAGCGQAEKSHADDWLRPDRGVGRARIVGWARLSLEVARFCTLPPPRPEAPTIGVTPNRFAHADLRR